MGNEGGTLSSIRFLAVTGCTLLIILTHAKTTAHLTDAQLNTHHTEHSVCLHCPRILISIWYVFMCVGETIPLDEMGGKGFGPIQIIVN
jgi:hypothetical protein